MLSDFSRELYREFSRDAELLSGLAAAHKAQRG